MPHLRHTVKRVGSLLVPLDDTCTIDQHVQLVFLCLDGIGNLVAAILGADITDNAASQLDPPVNLHVHAAALFGIRLNILGCLFQHLLTPSGNVNFGSVLDKASCNR